jgi:hypothetical protein
VPLPTFFSEEELYSASHPTTPVSDPSGELPPSDPIREESTLPESSKAPNASAIRPESMTKSPQEE